MSDLLSVTMLDKMSSLDIATITGKRHDNILRDIKTLLDQGVQALNFEESFTTRLLPNGGHKSEPCFHLTKKGCLILASGYDAVLREKIIDRWEALEKTIGGLVIPDFSNPADAARAWANEYEARQLAEQTIVIQAPKVAYYEKALSSDYTMPISVIAKDLGLSAITLNKKLAAANIQYKQGSVWLLYQKYANLGYARVIETPYDTPEGTGLRPSLKWTEKGKEFIMAAKSKGLI